LLAIPLDTLPHSLMRHDRLQGPCGNFQNAGRTVPELSDDAVRELLIKSYRLIYEIREDEVIILAFLHGARRFPSGLL
jgi:plasmid stabilization system protein ParE